MYSEKYYRWLRNSRFLQSLAIAAMHALIFGIVFFICISLYLKDFIASAYSAFIVQNIVFVIFVIFSLCIKPAD